MRAHLRAGIAIFNAGGYHAAHDAWEDHWLSLERDTPDELFLHGLIQYTAAVYHARNGNWAGATGLASSAREYLGSLPKTESLPETYRETNVGAVRSYLQTLEADPEFIERRHPLRLEHGGERLLPEDLDFESTAVAAMVVAEKRDEVDVLDQAISFARVDITTESTREQTGSPFVPLVFDYVREPENRGIILQRLSEHAGRRESRESDVKGLFEERGEQ